MAAGLLVPPPEDQEVASRKSDHGTADMSPPGRRSDVCDVRGSHDVTTLVEQPEQRSDAPCCVTEPPRCGRMKPAVNTCGGT